MKSGASKVTLMMVLLGSVLLFQNCNFLASRSFTSKNSASNKSLNAFSTNNGGQQIHGNGEGYSGKTEKFVNYDTGNQCGQFQLGGEPAVVDQIEFLNGNAYLTRRNCEDIEPEPLDLRDFDWRSYNPDHGVFANQVFQTPESLQQTRLVTTLLCRGAGNLDGVNEVDFLIQKDILTGQLYMSYYLIYYTDSSKTDIHFVDYQEKRLALYEYKSTEHGWADLYSAYINEENGYMYVELFRDNPQIMGDGWFYMSRNKALDGVMYNCY